MTRGCLRGFVRLSEIFSARFSNVSVGFFARAFFSALPAGARNRNRVRRAVDNFHAVDPLRRPHRSTLPPIDVLIASTAKDFMHVSRAILSAKVFSKNPIADVLVVIPRRDVALAREFDWLDHVVAEEDFLPEKLLLAAGRFQEISRSGWVIQQLISLYGAWKSPATGVLVVDSDTTFIAERTWIESSGRQILSFSYENHTPYEAHCERIWGPRKCHKDLSYVTHYMLMQPRILRKMFPSLGHFVMWLEKADLTESSGLADYHSYGRWLVDNEPRSVKIARWGNTASTLEGLDELEGIEQLRQLKRLFPGYLSVSAHSYL